MEYSNELYHHGTKGMRWGIRRYQNKDGSLTPAGKKRRAKLEGELEKLGGKKSAKKSAKSDAEAAPRKKTVSEMSDAELRDKVNRLQNERMYYELNKQISALNPKPVSKGRKFMDGLMNDVVVPAAKNTGRAWLEKFMKDKLGLNQEDPITRMEKQVRKLELTKKISDLKKGNEPDELKELEARYKKLDWEKKIRDLDKGSEPDELKELEARYKKLDWEKKISDLENPKSDDSDLSKALEVFRSTTEEERTEMKNASSYFENREKVRKKGSSSD